MDIADHNEEHRSVTVLATVDPAVVPGVERAVDPVDQKQTPSLDNWCVWGITNQRTTTTTYRSS